MPKRKVRQPLNNTQKLVAALFRVRELHSPCVNEECPIEFRHCTGCNEPFPCKTIYALEGTSPLKGTFVVEGEQSILVETKEAEEEEN